MRFLVIVLTFVVSSLSFGADRQGAFDKICKNLYAESTQLSCMQTVKKYSFYQDNALKICTLIYNEAGKISCLSNIGNKDYLDFEIDQCGKLYNDGTKLECLKTNGVLRTELPSCMKKEDLLKSLNEALNNLHLGEFSSVDFTLNGLITSLKNCQ